MPDQPSTSYFAMKIAAVGLTVALLAMLYIFSARKEHIASLSNRNQVLQPGPVDSRPFMENIRFEIPDEKSIQIFRGKVLHINFWAEWCEPCRRELPLLQSLQEQFGPERYQVILINLDTSPETRAAARRLQNGLIPSAVAVYENSAELAKKMNVEALPYHFVIDKSSRIATAFVAALDTKKTEYSSLIQQLLLEPSPTE